MGKIYKGIKLAKCKTGGKRDEKMKKKKKEKK